MSSTAGAIKGGMAYVQAYLDDNPVTQGLAKLRGKLKAWQASLSTMAAGTMGGELPEPFAAIARFAQSPAGAFTALLGAAKYTAEAREEMLRMSETTGVSVEKLSQYAYAARRAGISNEALASGLRRLESKEFMAAMQGLGGKGGAKGLTNDIYAKMGQGDAADKLREFIKLAQNMPSEEKIGLARRLGLSELLPLINQGVDQLDAFTARAKQLGLVMSEEDAKAGKKFQQAFGDLSDVLKSCVGQIGGALVPMITGLTNIIVRGTAAVRDWIKNHQALTIGIFAVTGAVVAGGIALKAFSIAVGLASAAVGLYKIVVGLATFVTAAFEAVLSPLVMPFVAIGAAIVGLAGYLVYASGAFSTFAARWKGFGDETSDSIKAIANAIAGGNLQAAWDVVTAYFYLEWRRLIISMGEALNQFIAGIPGALKKLPGVLWDASPGAQLGKWAANKLGGGKGEENTAGGESEPEYAAFEAAKERLQKAIAAVNAANANSESSAKNNPALAAANGEHRGTFSGAVAGMLGGGGLTVAEKQLRAVEDQLVQTGITNQKLDFFGQQLAKFTAALDQNNRIP